METSDDKTQLLPPDSIWILSAADRNLGDIIITPKQVTTFGRKTECDVVIPSQYVSRRHAEVFVEGGQLFVRDLDSTHGTLVNNQPVQQTVVNEGDEVRMDRAVFVVKRMAPPGGKTDSADISEDSDKTVIRSAADMAASMDKAVEEAKQAEKPAGGGRSSGGGEKAGAIPDTEAPSSPAESQPQPGAVDADKDKDMHRGKKNWWDSKEEGPMGTRFIKATDVADMVDREIAPVVEADRPMLIGISPSVSGLRIELRPGKLVVGKKADADIHLQDEFISDVHAQLIGEGERWKVVNVLSANGTFVNGKKVQSAYLKSGDVLRFGGLDIQFVNGAQGRKTASGASAGKSRRVLVMMGIVFLLALVIATVIGFTR